MLVPSVAETYDVSLSIGILAIMVAYGDCVFITMVYDISTLVVKMPLRFSSYLDGQQICFNL